MAPCYGAGRASFRARRARCDPPPRALQDGVALRGLGDGLQGQVAGGRETDVEVLRRLVASGGELQRLELDIVSLPAAVVVVVLAGRRDLHPTDHLLVRAVADDARRLDGAGAGQRALEVALDGGAQRRAPAVNRDVE